MAERVVSVRLQARVDGFTAGMTKAKASVDDLTKAAAPSKAQAFEKLGERAALAGVGIATAVGVAVKRFADFDQAMSAVKANSGATGAELESLRASAIKLGADSQFSATEAAQGINELAKAGVKTGDILSGGLKGSLDLAAAGQISVADAAETAATALTQFGLSGDKVPHIADLLANAANKAQGGVGDMALALKQAGLVAASTGLSIEETTAGLTAFASAGLIGSDAGTAFKTMLQRLSAPTADAKKEMDKLGISAYDSQGNFIGLANVAEQLKTGLSDLTPEQRNAAEATIFGSDAIRAANVLYAQGADGINRWTKEVSEQGAAAKQAATLTDNLKGDVERLGGALDSVFIQTGAGAGGGLRTLVQGITDLVNYVAKIPGPVLLAGGALTSLAVIVPKGVVAYREYRATLDAVGLSFEKISTKAPRTGAALEQTAAVAKRAGLAFATAAIAANTLNAAFGKDGSGVGVEGLTKQLLESDNAVKTFSGTVDKYAKSQSNWFNTDYVRSYGDVLKAAFDPSIGQGIDNVAGSIAGVSTDVSNANARLGELDQVLSGLVTGGRQTDAARIFGQFATAAKDSGISVDQLRSKLPQYGEALAGASTQTSSAGTSTEGLTSNLGQLQSAADEARSGLNDYVQSLQDAGLITLTQRDAQRQFADSIQAVTDRLAKRKELEAELAKAGGVSGRTKNLQEKANAGPSDRTLRLQRDLGSTTDAKKRASLERELTDSRAADAKRLGKVQSDLADSQSKDMQKQSADVARIRKELDGYKITLDQNTQAGRDNSKALDDVAKNALDVAKAVFNSTGSEEKYRASLVTSRAELIKTYLQFDNNKKRAEAYADSILKIPPATATVATFTVVGGAALKAAGDYLKGLQSKNVTLTVGTVKVGNGKVNAGLFAGGGEIDGPGTSTSDSIPIWASRGEFMQKAAAVDKYGTDFMHAVNTLRFPAHLARGYRDGGEVGQSRFAPSRLMGGPTTTTHTETHSAPIYVDKFMGPTVQSLEAEAERRRRMTNLLEF